MNGAILLAPIAAEGAIQIKEHQERWEAYHKARRAADMVGKPLLNVGCPRKYPLKYPCGDVCLDIDLRRLYLCQSPFPKFGDVRCIPFPDGYFGAALCTHVLEHLATVADAKLALTELARVSNGQVFLAFPSKSSIAAWVHPEHHLWITQNADGSVQIEQRRDQ
ncbi:MAG: methyltransferase domain-containing protein [Dehalococcoidales bacterium]|nr:methyltransferase domain-containing protein [Dehalococcoidales bacterium]